MLRIALSLVLCAPVAAAQDNVLVIVADDLGLDAVGVYGVGRDAPSTPNIDQLAATGMRFTNAWSYPLCSPTRATIQTGRYGFRTGVGAIVWPDTAPLPLEEVTLPELLDLGTGGGYAHAAFGKWHLGNDLVGGALAPSLAGYGHFSGTLAGVDDYTRWMHVEDGQTFERTGYLTTATADDALDWIQAASGPWFCYVAFFAPHAPLHAPPPELHDVELPPAEVDPVHVPRPYFKAMVEALDAEIGRLLAGLTGQLDETHVVFLGDNGTHGGWTTAPYEMLKAKSTLYQGGVHVPLIVRGPLVEQGGSVCGALVHSVDLFATVAELAGVDYSAFPTIGQDSVSFVPYLRQPGIASIRRTSYAEYFRPNGFGDTQFHRRAIRDRRYKLIEDEDGEELYDLARDPYETVDLLAQGLDPAQYWAYLELRLELDHVEAGTVYEPSLPQPYAP